MKKTMWMVVGAVVAASVVAATAQNEVLALNSIGYIKKQLPPGGDLITVSLPLHSMTAENHVFGNLSMAAEAPVLSEVSFWDVSNQRWTGGLKGGRGWDANVKTQEIASGEFFFLKGPDAAVDPTEITITGELPNEATLARSVPGSLNLGSMANPYPTDFVFGTSPLASNATVLSEVSFWDVDNQRWTGGLKGGRGWDANVRTQVVSATEGFFLKDAGVASQWTVDKPYTWP
jgi:hypothetical protein